MALPFHSGPRVAACFAAWLAAGSGCAAEREALRADLGETRRQVVELRRENLELRQRLAQIDARLLALTTRLEATSARAVEPVPAAPAPAAAPAARPTAPSLQVVRLAPPAAAAPAPPPAPAHPLPARASAGPDIVAPADALALTPPAAPPASGAAWLADYEEGLRRFHAGDHARARLLFTAFHARYKDTDYGDNALYWTGECHLAEGAPDGAIAAFQRVIDEYPTGNKVPDALFKMAEAHAARGDVARAREMFFRVAKDYPGTDLAAEAERRLEPDGAATRTPPARAPSG